MQKINFFFPSATSLQNFQLGQRSLSQIFELNVSFEERKCLLHISGVMRHF